MENDATIIDWQVEFERPFKGLLKSFGDIIHDNRIYKIYCSGKAIVEIADNFVFTAKVEKGESGKKQTMMANREFEAIIKKAIKTLGPTVFAFDGTANDLVADEVSQKLSGLTIKDFVINQVSADLRVVGNRGTVYNRFVVLHDKREENKREYGFDPFIETYEKPNNPRRFDDFDECEREMKK